MAETEKKKIIDVWDIDGEVIEGVPIKRMDYDISHNINKNPSKFERKHKKKEKVVANEKIYTKPISSKYFSFIYHLIES